MSDVNLLNVWPVTDDERRELDECAEAAPLAEHAIADALQEYPPDLTAAIFARAAIDDDDLTKVDLAWLYSHALVGHVDVRAQLEEAHEAFNASEAKRLEHEQTIADLRAQLETARAEVEHLKFERGEALLWSPWNAHDVLREKWAQRRAAGGLDVTHRCGACGLGVHWSTRRQWEHTTPAADGHTPACGATGPGGVTCSAQPSHGLAHWAGGVRTTTWTDRDMPTVEACGSHSGRYPNPDGVYCTLPPGHDGPHRTRRDEHEWTWSQSKPGMSSLHGRHMCGVVDFVSEVRCGRTRGHDGEHAVDEPPVQRASGGLVPSGQTATIGPAEPPPLPKRVKGTHGPTPEATR